MVNKKRIRHWVTDLVLPILKLTKADCLTAPFYSGIGSILMFHRVCPTENKIRIRSNAGLEVTPDYLEKLIKFLFFEKLNKFQIDTEYKFENKP